MPEINSHFLLFYAQINLSLFAKEHKKTRLVRDLLSSERSPGEEEPSEMILL